MTIRAAVGAGKGRLLRQMIGESLLVAAAAGAAGIALAYSMLGAVTAWLPADLPRADEVAIDARVLWFTGGVSLLAGVLFGLWPALRVSMARLEPAPSRPTTGVPSTRPGRPGQDNHPRSVRHVLRGLHYQIRQPQGKLVRVVLGEVFDVVVDHSPQSPTFGKQVGIAWPLTASPTLRSLRRSLRLLTVVCAVGCPIALAAIILAFRFIGERWRVTLAAMYLPRIGFALPLPFIVVPLHYLRAPRLLALQALSLITHPRLEPDPRHDPEIALCQDSGGIDAGLSPQHLGPDDGPHRREFLGGRGQVASSDSRSVAHRGCRETGKVRDLRRPQAAICRRGV